MTKILSLLTAFLSCTVLAQSKDYVLYTAAPSSIQFYLKTATGTPYKTFGALKTALEAKNQTLEFAMNGGMYNPDYSPVGLYIENGKTLKNIDANTKAGKVNFSMLPNGVFYIRQNGTAGVLETQKYIKTNFKDVQYATQSGPMLVIDGQIHPNFSPKSKSTYIRNAVCVKNGQVLFVISKKAVTLYHIASYFKNELKCQNALYLDGGISRLYYPKAGYTDLGGNFAILIAVAK